MDQIFCLRQLKDNFNNFFFNILINTCREHAILISPKEGCNLKIIFPKVLIQKGIVLK